MDKDDPILGFFHRWVLEFAKHFEEVHVICLNKGTCELPEHVFVYSLGKDEGKGRLTYLYRFYKYFFHVFFHVRVDFVFFHMGAEYNILAAPFFFLRKLFKTKFYWWKTHGHLSLQAKTALVFVDRVHTAIAESFPITTPKCKVVGHAIDTAQFSPDSVDNGTPVLLFVGRLSRIKRVEQVLEVAKRLKEKNIACITRIIGQQVDDEYYKTLNNLVTKYGLKDQVTFIPGIAQQALVHEYQAATVFMNPSDNDGLDKVVLEAMACGAVPITGNTSFNHMLSPYNLYMRKGNISGYTNRIIEVLNCSETKHRELQTQLRDVVVRDHALETITKRIFGIV